MNREQANKEAEKIFHEANKKADEIMEEAKKNGTWQMGLDSNNHLFKELDDETKKKLQLLKSMIDED